MTSTRQHFPLLRWGLALILSMAACLAAVADNTESQNKTLVVINSYDEYEPWGNDMAMPVAMYLAGVKEVDCDIVNMDNAIITDSAMYAKVEDNVFSRYEKKHPDYVVMVGNFAFNLRDRIKEEWGDIPMLLISRIPTFGSLEDNFTTCTTMVGREDGTPLSDVRDDYNFTTILIPDYHRESVDLMVEMIPDMKELVFFSTNIYVSRYTARSLQQYIKEKYPSLEFNWVKASKETTPVFRNYLSMRKPESGLLIASWVYEKVGARGYPTLTSNDLRMVTNSRNPVFSLREAYTTMGCIGGVFVDNERIKQEIVGVVKQMIQGKSMKEIPFIQAEKQVTKINYRLLTAYSMDEGLCPQDTVFLMKPKTFMDKYLWPTVAAFLAFLILTLILGARIVVQRKKIQRYNANDRFINNMPIPFAKADIRFGKDDQVKNIAYSTMNRAFSDLIKQNAQPENPFLLFPAAFISEKTSLLLKTKENVQFGYHFDKTDTYYDFTLCAVMVKDKDEYETLSVIDIFASDITERKKAEQKMRKALEQATESDRMKSAFLANMSHEIRTPLNAIVGFSNVLADNITEDPEMQKIREIINQNNNQLLTLINDVLDLARIESNTVKLRKETVNVNTLIENSLQTIRSRVQKGVELRAEISQPHCTIQGDGIRITQIITNFLANACKFTQEGSITCGYHILEGSQLRVYVKDTGKGISPEDQKIIFDRFIKLNSFAQGTGLGLSICQRLIEIMGGEIGVISEGEGKGSTFWFTLPNANLRA